MSPERLEDIRRAVEAGAKPRHTTLYRSCYVCKRDGRPYVHPIENFTIRKTGKYAGVPYSLCKDCDRARQKALRLAKKEVQSEG